MPRPRLLVLIALLLLPLLVFHRPLLGGEAFVPADLLSYLSPWKAARPPAPDAAAWNVLRFDGIAQFYPWRVEAARQMRAGHIPLQNTHQFAANGGTPLLANSQSAPLYPPHALFYLAPPPRLWYVFGLVAALHLGIAACGQYLLLRANGLRRGACLLGASAWVLSAPVICWLSLPSFLEVSCWLPWLLLLIRVAHTRAETRVGRLALLGVGGVGGMLILAGHLQIALYVLLTALLYAAYHGVAALRARLTTPLCWTGGVALASCLTLCLAAPQLLPSVELSRISHRVVTEKTAQLYDANNASALPPRAFVTLLAPDFYGHPNYGLHWDNSDLRDAAGHGGNNYAEWALYVGVLPLLLAAFACATPWRGDKGFFALLALLALLIATGTPLNRLLFYLVPGYAALANPGRVLVVFAFAASALAAFGAEALLDGSIPATTKRRGALIALTTPILMAAWGASLGAAWARAAVTQIPFGALMAQASPGLIIAGVLLALCAVLLFLAPRSAGSVAHVRAVLTGCILLTVADLGLWGYGYNPSSKPEAVYPVTPGIAWLHAHALDARIAVINRDWTLGQKPPRFATLPPNALTVYGLHDIGGYDSLFPKAAKEQVTGAGGGEDASPPANGNMVFVKRVQTALNAGAEYVVFAGDAPSGDTGLTEVYRGDDLVIGRVVNAAPTAAKTPGPISLLSFRIGLFLAVCAAAILTAGATALQYRSDRGTQQPLSAQRG